MTLRNLLIGTSVVLVMTQVVQASAPIEDAAAIRARARAAREARLAAAGQNASTSSTSQQVSAPTESPAAILARAQAAREARLAAAGQNASTSSTSQQVSAPAAPRPTYDVVPQETSEPRPQAANHYSTLPLRQNTQSTMQRLGEAKLLQTERELRECLEVQNATIQLLNSQGMPIPANVLARGEHLAVLQTQLRDTRALYEQKVQEEQLQAQFQAMISRTVVPMMQNMMTDVTNNARSNNLSPDLPFSTVRREIEEAVSRNNTLSTQQRSDIALILNRLTQLSSDPRVALTGINLNQVVSLVWAGIRTKLHEITNDEINAAIAQAKQQLQLN